MTTIRIKRVYEDPQPSDGYRVLVDRLWPRGMKKEYLKYDDWEKELTPSPALRQWFHQDRERNWDLFVGKYREELGQSEAVPAFLAKIKGKETVTLLYASRQPVHNHARVLQEYITECLA